MQKDIPQVIYEYRTMNQMAKDCSEYMWGHLKQGRIQSSSWKRLNLFIPMPISWILIKKNKALRHKQQEARRISFTITHPALGIAETDNKRLQLFINDNSLTIEKDSKILLNRVRIYAVAGLTIVDRSNLADNIRLPEMNTAFIWRRLITITINGRFLGFIDKGEST